MMAGRFSNSSCSARRVDSAGSRPDNRWRNVLAGLTPPDPPLTDGVVTLRLPHERDIRAMQDVPDPEIVRFIFGGTPTPPDTAAVLERYRGWWSAGTNAFFSVDAVGHEERVGITRVLLGLADPFGFAEIGYIFRPAGRGHGYATRTVRLLAGWVFDVLELGRIQARTHLDNVASQRVLERVGFQREGVARSGHVLPVTGERIDVLMWSLLPSDLVD
jgi:RimJ/RimL family protein N-acetyltransferase